MRRVWVLLLWTGLISMAPGCSKTMQCTQGVCDCYPPPVETLLQPYHAAHAPASPAAALPAHGAVTPAPALAAPLPTTTMPLPAIQAPTLSKPAESIPVAPKPMPPAK